jgi:hypothetical protein
LSAIRHCSGCKGFTVQHHRLRDIPASFAGLDRSAWLISGIASAVIGFSGAMVPYTTVSSNSSWEWDISLALLVLGYSGVALGTVVIMGWGPFASMGVNAAGCSD